MGMAEPVVTAFQETQSLPGLDQAQWSQALTRPVEPSFPPRYWRSQQGTTWNADHPSAFHLAGITGLAYGLLDNNQNVPQDLLLTSNPPPATDMQHTTSATATAESGFGDNVVFPPLPQATQLPLAGPSEGFGHPHLSAHQFESAWSRPEAPGHLGATPNTIPPSTNANTRPDIAAGAPLAHDPTLGLLDEDVAADTQPSATNLPGTASVRYLKRCERCSDVVKASRCNGAPGRACSRSKTAGEECRFRSPKRSGRKPGATGGKLHPPVRWWELIQVQLSDSPSQATGRSFADSRRLNHEPLSQAGTLGQGALPRDSAADEYRFVPIEPDSE